MAVIKICFLSFFWPELDKSELQELKLCAIIFRKRFAPYGTTTDVFIK